VLQTRLRTKFSEDFVSENKKILYFVYNMVFGAKYKLTKPHNLYILI